MKYSENPSKFGEVLKEKSKQQVLQLIGHSNYHSEFDIWSYNLIQNIFFRIYTQHLILYAPTSAKAENTKKQKPVLPRFRKNIYTKEIIDFILEQINTKKMTKTEVMERYGIPKTTLYKWISKYKNLSNI